MPPITDGTARASVLPSELSNRPSSGDLLTSIDESMRADPAFRVLTVEGTHWIDPFTGRCIPAPDGSLAPAREYLVAERPWTRARLKRLGELQVFRWRLYVHHYVDQDWRLRQFAADGRWLNPFSGEWTTVIKADGAITPKTLRAMATHLANCPHAANGRMLPQRHLDALTSAARPTESKGTTRISGWRAGQPETRSINAPPPSDPTLARLHDTIERMLPPLPSVAGYALRASILVLIAALRKMAEWLTGGLLFFESNLNQRQKVSRNGAQCKGKMRSCLVSPKPVD